MADELRQAGIESILRCGGIATECVGVTTVKELRERLRDARQCAMLIVDLDFDEAVFEVIAKARSRAPELRVLAFDLRRGADRAVRAFRSGVLGVIGEGATRSDIAEAIDSVMRGKRFVHGDAVNALVQQVVEDSGRLPHYELSNREYETLCLFGAGKRLSDIARAMSISVKTVSTYRARLLEKLKMSTTAELIRYAVTHNLANGACVKSA
ncbi:response regulator transcription factor [Burkholderia sp. Tr-20390]|nr:response regulator transcription factor [Burkholderia sp. Tr-20390]